MRSLLKGSGAALFLFFATQALASDINKSLTVNFVTAANYYPFEYLDNAGQIQGFDIDIAKATCLAANLICKFHSQRFDNLLFALQFGRFDAAIAALDITEERKQKVDFSNSYYQFPPVFISAIQAHQNTKQKFYLAGKFIGVQANSSNYSYLVKYASKDSFIIAYPSSTQAFSDLSDGKIDIVFADQAVASAFLLHNKNHFKFSMIQTETLFLNDFSDGYGIAVKKGNSKLLDRLNYGLKKIEQAGTYQQIFNRYFNYTKPIN